MAARLKEDEMNVIFLVHSGGKRTIAKQDRAKHR